MLCLDLRATSKSAPEFVEHTSLPGRQKEVLPLFTGTTSHGEDKSFCRGVLTAIRVRSRIISCERLLINIDSVAILDPQNISKMPFYINKVATFVKSYQNF